jgi:hypothetical protein
MPQVCHHGERNKEIENLSVSRSRWWEFGGVAEANRSTLGYLLGVATGAVAFWLIGALMTWIITGINHGVQGLSVPMYAVMAIVYFAFLIAWVLASWILVIVPFLLVRRVAWALSVVAAEYYICCGVTIGLLLCALHEFVGARARAGEALPWPDHIIALAGYGLGGALGAFVFWWIGFGTAAAPRRSPDHFTACGRVKMLPTSR